jgi:undecaprenyl-diphosphatase
MTIFQAVILGIIQGITEFLPISSSGHLVLAPYIFGWEFVESEIFVFNVLVQMGTLVAVIAYFYRDLKRMLVALIEQARRVDSELDEERRLAWLVLLATFPAATFGYIFKPLIEAAFNSTTTTGLALLVTAGLLVFAEMRSTQDAPLNQINWKDALVIGLFQLLALFPGVSRSGSTIAGGMTRQLSRPAAARFSFLISIPIMIGAGLSSLNNLFELTDLGAFLLPMVVGFLTSALVGYLSIRWLLTYLGRYPLYTFAVYVAIVGTITLITLPG